jgi:hypothetical protein
MLRVAQIASVSTHSPWFADICGEMTRRGYDVFAIIDSGSGNLGARLTSLGIRHYKVPMHFAESLDRARLPFYLFRLPISALSVARILRREKADIAQSHIFVANLVTKILISIPPSAARS